MSVWGDQGTAHGWLSYALGDDASDQHSLLFARHGQVPAAQLSDFRYIHNLGVGTWGAVILVSLVDSYEIFAMKVMEKDTLIKTEMVEQSVEEQVLQGLASASPLVVNLRYAFQTERKICIVMDYLPGGDLFRLLSRQPRNLFSEAAAKFYAAEIALALLHLHKLGIMYRDMKLENVLLSADGHARLTDFGLAKKVFSKRTSTIVGTPEYMAPEILQSKAYDNRVDWWAFGVCLFVMMVGKYPVTSSPIANQISASRNLSISCVDLLQSLLTKKPKKRLAGTNVIKHPWFSEYDFDAVERFDYEPPIRVKVEPLPDPHDLPTWPVLTEELLDSHFTPVTAATPTPTPMASVPFAPGGGSGAAAKPTALADRMRGRLGRGSSSTSTDLTDRRVDVGHRSRRVQSLSASTSNNRSWARSTPDLSRYVAESSRHRRGSHNLRTIPDDGEPAEPSPALSDHHAAGREPRHHHGHHSRHHHSRHHGHHSRHHGHHTSHRRDTDRSASKERSESRGSRSASRERGRSSSASRRPHPAPEKGSLSAPATADAKIKALEDHIATLESDKRTLAASVATQAERIRQLQVTTTNLVTEMSDLRDILRDLETRVNDSSSLHGVSPSDLSHVPSIQTSQQLRRTEEIRRVPRQAPSSYTHSDSDSDDTLPAVIGRYHTQREPSRKSKKKSRAVPSIVTTPPKAAIAAAPAATATAPADAPAWVTQPALPARSPASASSAAPAPAPASSPAAPAPADDDIDFDDDYLLSYSSYDDE